MPFARLVSLILLPALAVATEPPRDPLQNPGFIHFYNNEYDAALAEFERQLAADPNSANICNWVAQALLYREMYRNGSLESQLVTGSNSFLRRAKMEVSPADKQHFFDVTGKAMSLSEARLKTNPKDIYALHAIVVAHGLRSNFDFLVEKSWMQALREATAGNKLNEQILEIAPNYTEAYLVRGVSEYVVGSMPAYLRFLGSMRGFHGDRDDGVKQLQKVAASQAANRFDAAIILAAIYRRDHRPKDAVPLLDMLARTFPRNILFRFEQVQMYSDLGDKNTALNILAQIDSNRREHKPGFDKVPLERVLYARGNLLFWYGDLNGSLADLKGVTARPESLDLSTTVMAWLRLGQVYDLRGDRPLANHAYTETIAVAPGSEAAKEAAGYLDKPYKRKKKAT